MDHSLEDNKKIFLISYIIALIVEVTFVILSLAKVMTYKVAVGYMIGLMIGNALHYLTIKIINKTSTDLLKTVVGYMTIVKNFIYILVLVGVFLVSKNIWAFIACVGGLTTIKLSIVLFVLLRRKNG